MGHCPPRGFWYPIKNYQGVFGSLIEIIKGFLVPYKKLPRGFWEPNLNHQGVFGQVSFFGPRGFWTRGFWEWFRALYECELLENVHSLQNNQISLFSLLWHCLSWRNKFYQDLRFLPSQKNHFNLPIIVSVFSKRTIA